MPVTAQLVQGVEEVVLSLPLPLHPVALKRQVFVVCSGESCRKAGSHRLLGLLRRQCAQPGESHDVRVSSSKCLGRCAIAPAMVNNGRVLGWVSLQRLKSELLLLGLLPLSA